MTANEIIQTIERFCPRQLQEDYDNAGLQCGDTGIEVNSVLCCLDVTEQVIEEAIAAGYQMVVSHHPILFRGLKCITPQSGDYTSRCVYKAITHGIVLYAAHTNLDNAPYGVNYIFASRLGLTRLKPLAEIPSPRLEGLDDRFRLSGSGIVGELEQAMSASEFIAWLSERIEAKGIRTNGDLGQLSPEKMIRRVALCGGAGSDFIGDAERHQADAYVTGEIGYHQFFGHPDLLLVEAGHYETERHTAALLAGIIAEAHPSIQTRISEITNPTRVYTF